MSGNIYKSKIISPLGINNKFTELKFKSLIEKLGGIYNEYISPVTDYVIYGTGEEDCKRAKYNVTMKWIAQGASTQIIDIDDFINSIQDIVDISTYLRKETESESLFYNSDTLEHDSYVIFDTETTGLSHNDDIIQLSALKIENDIVIDKFSTYIYTDKEITRGAYNVHHINKLMLSNAPQIDEVLINFREFIKNNVLIAHNINFDIARLTDAINENNIPFYGNAIVDTLDFARSKVFNSENHKLTTLCEYFNIDCSNAHDSLADCSMLFECYKKLKSMHPEIPVNTNRSPNTDKKRHNYFDVVSADDIKSTVLDIDENNLLYGKICVFTGELENYSREDAMQIVVNNGGICKDNLTLETNYLICGVQDEMLTESGKSGKQKKAEDYIAKGNDIQILYEQDFIKLLELIESNEISLSKIDKSHPLYNKKCVFTGKSNKYNEQTEKNPKYPNDKDKRIHLVNYFHVAKKWLKARGGISSDKLTPDTDILVYGTYQDKNGSDIIDTDNMIPIAEELNKNGANIQIISDFEYFEMTRSLYPYNKSVQCFFEDYISDNNLPPQLLVVERSDAVDSPDDFSYNFYGSSGARITESVAGKKSILVYKALLNEEDFSVIDHQYKSIKTFEGWKFVIDSDSDKTAINHIIKTIIERSEEFTIKTFDCCSRYMQCSDEMHCVHPDPMHSCECIYKFKLHKGKIFFGKNRNV